MRRAAHIDVTQPEAIRQLRDMGATVQPLHTVGGGCPDLLVGFRGLNILIEMKTEDRGLNETQAKWFDAWGGTAVIANSAEQACKLVVAQAKDAGKL